MWFPRRAFLAILLGLAAVGCSPSAPPEPGAPDPGAGRDAARVRRFWRLPPEVRLEAVSSRPPLSQSGTFGREGLRISATFAMTKQQFSAWKTGFRSAEWLPAPVPVFVLQFREGPEELADIKSGEYLAEVGGESHEYQPRWGTTVGSVPPAQPFSHYWVAGWDAEAERLRVVFKAYY